MTRQVVSLLLALLIVHCNGFIRSTLFKNFGDVGVSDNGDPGEPLFLTPYIKSGNLEQAREASKVTTLSGTNVESYSAYFTTNETCGSNMFFWFFPAQTGDKNAPVLLWLQGGPGGTSMFGIFNEHGPFSVNSTLNLVPRPYTWSKKFSVVYIDNPVGTGFSFTGKDECYAKNEDDVARDLHSALSQFFTVFSDYAKNDFYATGESYAGKYVPAISLKIHEENMQPKSVFINLKGMIIGDGLCDPESMFPSYAPFMFNIGLLDENQRDFFAKNAAEAVGFIKQKQFQAAFVIFDNLLNGDLTGYKPWFYNQTGLDNYYNYLLPTQPVEFLYMNKYLVQSAIRKSIHVGNTTFSDGQKVEKMIMLDVMDTVKPRVAAVLDANYKVLMYSGMLDIIVALPLTEAFLQTVPWEGLNDYKAANRTIWHWTNEGGDADVAGYIRIARNLVQVGVRGGGHILPYDQPARAFTMVEDFIMYFNPSKN